MTPLPREDFRLRPRGLSVCGVPAGMCAHEGAPRGGGRSILQGSRGCWLSIDPRPTGSSDRRIECGYTGGKHGCFDSGCGCESGKRVWVACGTWMTTSDESSTLYSSPQMRLDWPFWRTQSLACVGIVGRIHNKRWRSDQALQGNRGHIYKTSFPKGNSLLTTLHVNSERGEVPLTGALKVPSYTTFSLFILWEEEEGEDLEERDDMQSNDRNILR